MSRGADFYMEPSLGPETSASHRKSKFVTMAGNSGRIARKPKSHSPYASDKDFIYVYAGNKQTYLKALTLRGSFENSAAKIIKARQGMKDRAQADVLSNFTQDMYRDPSAIRRGILSYSAADFKDAFDQLAVDDSITILDVEDVVKKVMGINVPQWILSKFDKLGRSVAQYKKISWYQFREIVPLAQEICDVECEVKKATLPPHLRPQTAPERSGLVPYKSLTCYMSDFEATRFQDLDTLGLPPKKSGTTRELFTGTTKATEQLPAYGGHIPINVSNIRKYEHSYGKNPRPHPCYLRLVSERLGSVPNYTGHIPVHTGLESDRTCGMDPRTTTGAAYASVYK